MKKLFATISAITMLVLFMLPAVAQIRTPSRSTTAELKQTVGRMGANSATKITFGDDVKIGGKELKKGSYALYTKPDASEWTVMLFNYDTPNAAGYGDKTPVVTFMAKPKMLGDMVESFTIDVNNITNTTADINLMWEKT